MQKKYQDRCLPDRHGMRSRKWDDLTQNFGREDLIPLWIADMDFKVPACVQEAMHDLVNDGAFGYFAIPDGYYRNFIEWEKSHHGYEVDKKWIRFTPGVVCCIHWFVQIMSNPGDAVIMFAPVYYPFMHAATDTQRKLVMTPLVNTNGYYTIDFERFEKDIVENCAKVLILSSPHNPVCRVWKPEELKQILDICRKHDVFVISDEIHHDLLFNGAIHTPTATLGDYDHMLVTLTAPSKTFNLAGLQNSYIIIPNEDIRKKFDDYESYLRIKCGNSFGYVAAESAYKGGQAWLDAVLEEIGHNYEHLKTQVCSRFPKIVFSPLEGTYLSWIDFGAYIPFPQLEEFIKAQCHLAPDFGSWFYSDSSVQDTHIRINLATPHENIKKVTDFIIRGLENHTKSK